VIALDHIGLPTLIQLAGRMGITTLSDADRFGLSLTLGGGEVPLIDLTTAFAAFANGGQRVYPTTILQVQDASGRMIERWQATRGERVLDERVAYLITDILSDNNARAPTFGFNSVLQIGRPAAVKTGTTTDYRDNWAVGYTPELVAGVWVGNADNSPMVNLSGVAGAGPIWHDFMRAALAGKPETPFVQPPGLTRAEVCAPSGLLPTPLCPRTRTELFLEGAAPTAPDNLYQSFNLDARTGQPADANTPPEAIVSQVFMVLPSQAREWAAQNGIPQPPAASLQPPVIRDQLQITSPDPRTVYQLSPRLPRESQRIPLRVISNQPLSGVTFLLNDNPIGTVAHSSEAGPFEVWWRLEPGSYRLQAQARLTSGENLESDVVEFVVNP